MGFGIAEEKGRAGRLSCSRILGGLCICEIGLVPLIGALQELVLEREEEGGVQRGEAVCLCFRVAFGVVLGERVDGLRFLYNSYNSALVDLRGAWMSEWLAPALD